MRTDLGHYRLLRPLARSRCEVYEAENTISGQRVALKILPTRRAPDTLRAQLRQDMTITVQLRDEPHLVPVDEWGELDGRFYLQMPLLAGSDLQTLLDRDGPLEPAAAADLVDQLAAALEAAHRAGLIHTGIAPQNILVGDDGSAYLLGLGYRDFLAQCEAYDDVLDPGHTLADARIGWPPEQFTGNGLSERAHVYALAAVAYACLTGAPADRAGTATPSQLLASLPTGVDDVVNRGMSRDPADRFATATHLAHAIRDALVEPHVDEPPAQFGQYRLLRRLPGRRHACYEAEDTTTSARVAVQMFRARDADDPLVRRVKREVSMATLVLRPLGEPQLVLVDHVGEVDGQFYVQLPYIEGVALGTLLDRYGPLSPSRAVQVVSHIAGALDAVHGAVPLPGAVVPDRILVSRHHLAYLLCEPVLQDDDPDSSPLDTEPPVFGYLAPERFQTGDRTNAGDRYSLACILYACLTGVSPFGGSAAEQIRGLLANDAPRPSEVNTWVPRTFDAVIARGMAKDPRQRYQSAGELAAAARAALESVAAPTMEEAIPLPTAEISAVTVPLQLPGCGVCGHGVVVDSGRSQADELLCESCRRQGLPGELVRRLQGASDEPVIVAGFVLLETLDRGGGPGQVFRARKQVTGDICVLRVVAKTAVAPDEARRSAPLADLSGLRNPNVVALQEVIPVGEFLLVVSEYCPGDTVQGLVRRLGRLSVRQAMSVVLPCLDGIDAAHSFMRSDGSMGVMHRNITPASLLLTWTGPHPVTKIADFGFATPTPPDPEFTPRPQVVRPDRAARDVDTWRMGACLYYMLSGAAPRQPSDSRDPAEVVMSTTATPIRRLNLEVPPRLAAVIDDAVTDAPHISIPTASHLAAALRAAMRFS